MKTTLVTTCWNERSSVEHWLGDVLGQSRMPDEIIIIDNFSSDGTYEYLMGYADKVTVLQKECTVAQGRNEAIRQARNEIIVSTDMGTILDTKWFENIVKTFDMDPTVNVVAGNYEFVYPLRNGVSRAEYYISKGGRANMTPGFLPSSRNIAFKKPVWEKISGYQEGLKNATDDTIFAHEIHHHGFKMALAPDSLVYWNRHETLDGYLKEASRYAYGNGEARIRKPILTVSTYSSFYPLWKAIHAFYHLKRAIKPLIPAIKAKDYAMLFHIPHFLIMDSLTYSTFYRKGYLVESESLKGLRERIKELGLS